MRPSAWMVAVLLGAAGLVVAQPAPRELRRVLPLLQPAERARILEQVRQWGRWSASERQAFTRRAQDWDALPAAERQRRRADWAAYRALPPADRLRVREAAARHAGMDPAAQAALRARYRQLAPVSQHGWRLGPSLGVDYPRLQPLLAQVPVEEHAGLLRALHAMTPIQREDLAVLVRRTPPQERERLRRELVSTDDAARGAWLQARLDR